jgi:cytochrome c peroxidase
MRFRFTVFLLLFSLTAQALAVDVAPVKPLPPVHLVGHEDTPLLLRVQDVIDDWDPRKLRDPYAETVYHKTASGGWRKERLLRRPDLNEFVADVTAMEALGKAFFWEMQAGSDFRRLPDGSFHGTACASCHYRFGADARNRHTRRIPFVVWEKYDRDPKHPLLDEPPQPYHVTKSAVETIRNLDQLKTNNGSTPLSLIIGSQGVPPFIFRGLQFHQGSGSVPGWFTERATPRSVEPYPGTQMLPEHTMFVDRQLSNGKRFRPITSRNSPTVVNAVFSDRLFHDGRAESTFNGFSIAGDQDRRSVLYRRRSDGTLAPTEVAIVNAALASQAVGPIISDIEMSYTGRAFPDVARKLLDASVLGFQEVSSHDSVLGPYIASGEVGCGSSYRRLIRRAFRREWWDDRDSSGMRQLVPLELAYRPRDKQGVQSPAPLGDLMEANFSLYWGLSIMFYEAMLVSNNSPFDQMLRGNAAGVNQRWEQEKAKLSPIYLDVFPTVANSPRRLLTSGAEVFQRGHRLFMNRGCVECHAGPFMSEIFDRNGPLEVKKPIHHTLQRLLLPVSKGDAIAVKLEEAQQAMLTDVAAMLASALPAKKDLAQRIAVALDALREEARGREVELRQLIATRLQAAGFPESSGTPPKNLADEIAQRMMTFEKHRPTFSGDRDFFTEEERVRYATKLVENAAPPVFVEFMAIPPALAKYRPKLPIAGSLAPFPYAFYDLGFYNLGVSPPRYDRGNGAWSDTVEPPYAAVRHDLTWLRGLPIWNRSPELEHLPAAAQTNDRRRSDTILVSRARFLAQNEEPTGHRKPFLHDNELMFWGSFRTPTLRNVELTAPYMHNGRLLSLSDVIEFYDQGGDVPADLERNPDKHPAMRPLDMSDEDQRALVFFLLCLTDNNVRHERAPFDHPSLTLVNGYEQNLTERFVRIDEVGAHGQECPPSSFPSDD